MEQKLTLLAGILVIALPVITMLQTPEQPVKDQNFVNASFYNNGSQSSWVMLDIADNKSERRKGLMNVTELGKHEGMLFKYNNEGMRGFWMKNTLIPLDMIFLDSDKEVINVETARPETDTAEENLTIYRSERPAKYVIEVNAGFTDNYSIRRGTQVSWNR